MRIWLTLSVGLLAGCSHSTVKEAVPYPPLAILDCSTSATYPRPLPALRTIEEVNAKLDETKKRLVEALTERDFCAANLRALADWIVEQRNTWESAGKK
jgi:hypothetical protein